MDLREHLQSSLGTAYTLEHELGGGGMSRVFVADEKAFGRKVVVKVLPPELTQGVSVERFRREIQLAAQLQHPHIVPVHAAGELDGLPYYTMPFVEGTSLRARLAKGGPLPIAETTNLLREVAKALAYAHDRGVVHRDIKPDNVLITGGSAVVTDFGIAKALSASKTAAPGGTLTQMGTSIGTPAYMAPEQAAGDPDTDHRADLYSFACMAYELLAGEPPFTARAPQKLLAAHMAETPRPVMDLRPDTPPLLAEMITRCLAKDPDRRPQSAHDLVKVLETVSANSGGGNPALPAILLSGRPRLFLALAIYAAAFVAVVILAKAAVVGIGLPTWVVTGAVIAMALGLPVILFTAFVHHGAHRALTMAHVTPGGTRAVQSTMARLAVKASPWVTWRRTTIGGAVALGVLALLTAAYMTMRAMGIGSMGSLMAQGALGKSERILISDFRSPPNDSTLGLVVTEAFRTDLSQSRNLQVVDASRIRQVLQRMRRPTNVRLDFPLAREIATREGIKAVMDGEVLALGGSYIIAAKLYAAQNGDLLAAFRVTAKEAKDIIPAIGELSRQVRAKVGESLRTVNASSPLERVTTPSLEALRKYVQANQAVLQNEDFDRSIALLEEAIAIDTGFAMAYRKLSAELTNRGGAADRAADAMAKAYAHRDRLSDMERYLTVAAYHTYGPQQDRRKAIEAYESLLEMDPKNTTAMNNAALAYFRLREYAKAEALAARAVATDPTARVYFSNLFIAQMAQGKLDSAAQTIILEKKHIPGTIDSVIYGARLAVVRGQHDSADALLRAAYRARGSDRAVRRPIHIMLGHRACARGRIADCMKFDRELLAISTEQGIRAAPLTFATQEATAEALFLEQKQRAVAIMENALRQAPLDSIPPLDRPYEALAGAYAEAGRPDRARTMLAEYQRARRGLRIADAPRAEAMMRGHVAMAEGRYADAAREYTIGDQGPCGACALPYIARAYDLAGNADSAIAVFTRFVSNTFPQMAPERWFLAGAHKRLGELHEARGDLARAATHYVKFLELWKHADPPLQPKVGEVRQRLARLTAEERR